MSSSEPWRNISSHTKSSVYVAVRKLHPLLHTKIFPKSLEERGTLPAGYRALKVLGETIEALPLIEANGFISQDGVMYNSF